MSVNTSPRWLSRAKETTDKHMYVDPRRKPSELQGQVGGGAEDKCSRRSAARPRWHSQLLSKQCLPQSVKETCRNSKKSAKQ